MVKVYVNNTRSKRQSWIIKKSAIETCRNLGIKNKIVSITLIDDTEIKSLNKKYMKRNYPTDILSFSLDDEKLLGDIYISRDTAKKNAKKFGNSLNEEISFLTIHGVLHLVGYDHHNKSEKKLMENKEEKIFNKVWGGSMMGSSRVIV